MIRVMLFAGLSEAVGEHVVNIPSEGPLTIRDIREQLISRYPMNGLEEKLRCSFAAVNQRYCSDETEVTHSDEVAFIPPVSGG